MACPMCKSLIIKSLDGTYIHQPICPDYTGGVDADKARELLNKVRVGHTADMVLDVLDKPRLIKNSGVREYDDSGKVESLVVDWEYEHYILRMARGYNETMQGVYAVQEIVFI